MIAEMLMESIFALVDIIFVSMISVEAVAVVGLTESTLTIIYSLGFGLSMGATALVARRVGEKDPKGAAEAGMQAIYLGIGIGDNYFINWYVLFERHIDFNGCN
jgi:Na+-driven multidrug efflux pump